MGSFLDKAFRITSLVLIIALLFNVYNSHAQTVGGIGQQEPVKFAGMLAANLTFCNAHSERQLDFSQLSLRSCHKWLKSHNGYCNSLFSRLTIEHYSTPESRREITLGRFHFGYMYKILFKAVQTIRTWKNSLSP
jgi:hypothetical protein